MADALACQVLFGKERGDRIRELVEDSIGEVCPCLAGLRCPLEPAPAVQADNQTTAA